MSEQATIQLYEWERRTRGYYHFEAAVKLEPYFSPLHFTFHPTEQIDDGRIPTLLDELWKKIKPSKLPEVSSEKQEELLAYIEKPTTELVGFSIIFPQGVEIQPRVFSEVINLLSYTEHPISFEILGNADTIRIQIVSHPSESQRIQSQLQSYFPNIIIQQVVDVFDIGIDMYSEEVAICDFGLSEECMRPINTVDNFGIDPLTSIIGTLDTISGNDVVLFQILFQGVKAPWATSLCDAVSDGQGGSFFSDAPEMPNLAKEKTSNPLFAVVMRIAVESYSVERSEYISQELIRNISSISQSPYNALIPFNNKGYVYNDHLRNVFLRCSNRLGMILNTRELVHFVHYPNKTIVSSKLGIYGGKTKAFKPFAKTGITIGTNIHNGIETPVIIDTISRLSHTHIIGSTGVGKSTLVANIALEDINNGKGLAVFDPHGDLVDDILKRIPKNRIFDVILIDPSDIEFPIGVNLLQAHTEAEKIVLSSDIVLSFKQHATAWGDNMTAVLTNAVNTILESTKGGTLIELKRFLIEEKFRNDYLQSVDDPSLHYYWNHEYIMVRKGIAPLLTRIDTFLRPKIIRYMFAKKQGIDFRACMDEGKIVLVKLSQGLIGESNSNLLASLLLAKFNQVAMGRQTLAKEQRVPFNIICDEFQNYISNSFEKILSGTRKYGLGLTLVHQELAQIHDLQLLNSVISNPHTRICFRLGDNDAKKLESGFSYFEAEDFQSLERGQALVRIGTSKNDFSMSTRMLDDVRNDYSQRIIYNVRDRYATARNEIEELLRSMLPDTYVKKKKKQEQERKVTETPSVEEQEITPSIQEIEVIPEQATPLEPIPKTSNLETQKEEYLAKRKEREELKRHRYLQNYIAQMAQQRGFKSTLEKQTDDKGRIDVVLEYNSTKIAIEIAITNSIDYEVNNIQKCINDGYTIIWVVSDSKVHLKNIKKRADKELVKKKSIKIQFFQSDEVIEQLDTASGKQQSNTKRIQGYRVTTNFKDDASLDGDAKQNEISEMILRSLRNTKKKS